MRWAAVVIAVGIVAGCEDKRSSPRGETSSSPAITATGQQGKIEAAANRKQTESETDGDFPHFDPADANRTLRWIAAQTQQSRLPNANRAKAAELWKSTKNALTECLQKTIDWKLPVDGISADGNISFAQIRTTAFLDPSEKHPALTLKIHPWNSTRLDSVFATSTLPWLPTVRVGQDSVTVHGLITAITMGDIYDWHISLSNIYFTPASEPAAPARTEKPALETFDASDPDKTFAWLRQQIYPALDPFGSPADRERHKKELLTHLQALEKTKVRWRWPTTVSNDYAIALQDLTFTDYPLQMSITMKLYLKQPKPSGKSGQSLPRGRSDYGQELFGSVDNKVITPEVTGKIRESKKSTISGKIAKVIAADGGIYPPRALEIAIRLDDIVVEP